MNPYIEGLKYEKARSLQLAAECADKAVKTSRTFTRLSYADIAFAIIFIPCGFLSLISGLWIAAIFLIPLGIKSIFDYKENTKTAGESYQEFMKLREDVLGTAANIDRALIEAQGYDVNGLN